MENTKSLPLADPQREEMAEQLFPEYKEMSPEEWAARFGHTVGCSSFDDYSYRNPELHDWVHKLHHIFRYNHGQIEDFKLKYLSAEEIEIIESKRDNLF
jgi:hypothetical protein